MTVQARLAHSFLFQKLRVHLIGRKLDRFCKANSETADLVDKFNLGLERDLFDVWVFSALSAIIIGRVYDVLLQLFVFNYIFHFFSCNGADAVDFKRIKALNVSNGHLCLNVNLDSEVFLEATLNRYEILQVVELNDLLERSRACPTYQPHAAFGKKLAAF